jgi:hypothetical protein
MWFGGVVVRVYQMSSMYMDSHPSRSSVANISFIIVWKVAGELVSPKNMTRVRTVQGW